MSVGVSSVRRVAGGGSSSSDDNSRGEVKTKQMGVKMVRVGIIGAGGRKEDGDGMTVKMLEKMCELVPLVLRHHFQLVDFTNLELASSGGPFASHVAPRHWLSDTLVSEADVGVADRIVWRAFHLYLPAPFVNGKYDDTNKDAATRVAAGVYNQLHAQFSQQLGKDTLVDVATAVLLEAEVHIHAGFLARDERLAEACDILVAFTWGDSGSEPKAGSGGAARQTWDYCRGKKLHIRLKQLDTELAHYKQLHSRFRSSSFSSSSSSSSASRKQKTAPLDTITAPTLQSRPVTAIASTVPSPSPPPPHTSPTSSSSSRSLQPSISKEHAKQKSTPLHSVTTKAIAPAHKTIVSSSSNSSKKTGMLSGRGGGGGFSAGERFRNTHDLCPDVRGVRQSGKRPIDLDSESETEDDSGAVGAHTKKLRLSGSGVTIAADDDDGYHTDDGDQVEYAPPPKLTPLHRPATHFPKSVPPRPRARTS
jgi:hypothetical protein